MKTGKVGIAKACGGGSSANGCNRDCGKTFIAVLGLSHAPLSIHNIYLITDR